MMGKVVPDEVWMERQFRHTANRLRERYNIVIGRELYKGLCSVAKVAPDRVPYSRNSRFEVRLVNWMSRDLPVAWDIFHEAVASVLPSTSLKYFRERALPRAGKTVSAVEIAKVLELTKVDEIPTEECVICGSRYIPRGRMKDSKVCSDCKGAIGVLRARPELIYRLCTQVLTSAPCEHCAPRAATEYPFFGHE